MVVYCKETIDEYTCGCGNVIITEDLDEGTKLLMIICPECGKYMLSGLYHCDQRQEPEYFWFRPTYAQFVKQVKWYTTWGNGGTEADVPESVVKAQWQLCSEGGMLALAPSKLSIEAWTNSKSDDE